MYVRYPMVISIGIGYYDKNMPKRNKEYKGYADDLDAGVRRDIDNSINVFGNTFKYDVFPQEYEGQNVNNYRAYWLKKDLIQFLERKAMDLDSLSYDGLIALISCHGIDEHILTSDYGLIPKTKIHRIFSKSGQSRDIREYLFLIVVQEIKKENLKRDANCYMVQVKRQRKCQ